MEAPQVKPIEITPKLPQKCMEEIRNLVNQVSNSLEHLKKSRFDKLTTSTCAASFNLLMETIKGLENPQDFSIQSENNEVKVKVANFEKCFFENSKDLLHLEGELTRIKGKNLNFLADQLKECHSTKSGECVAKAFSNSADEVREELNQLNSQIGAYLI